MKFLRLIWTGLWRKKIRTVFTVLAIIVAFLLFGMLQGVDSTFKHMVGRARLNVLLTRNPAGLPLPLAELAQIQAVRGVRDVTYQSALIGDYQSVKHIVVVLPIDSKSWLAQNAMYVVSPAQRATFLRTRTGVLVAQRLAQRLGWKVGDQIPIHAFNARKTDGTSDWTLNVVGTFDIPNSPQADSPLVLMNYPYFDSARALSTGTVQMYQETIADASQAAAVSNAIDNRFSNSAHRTHTQTERATAEAQFTQLGDLDLFVEAILAATFATLLLLTGTTLMQAYRERTHEFAVMKTLGFTDSGISLLVLGEAVLLCVGAAVVGLLIAGALLPGLSRVLPQAGIPRGRLSWIVCLSGIGFALLLALVSALPPAWRARRLSIVDALAVN